MYYHVRIIKGHEGEKVIEITDPAKKRIVIGSKQEVIDFLNKLINAVNMV